MPEIVVRNEFQGITDRRTVASGQIFAEVAMREWPDGFPDHQVLIYGPDLELVSDESAVMRQIQDGECWTIQLQPKGIEILGVSIYLWILAAVSLAASFLMRPDLPRITSSTNYEWDDSGSPQFFSGQSNELKPGQRIPECFGTIKVYPDLLAPSVVTYNGDTMNIREMYSVSRGTCNITNVRIHDEDLLEVPGSFTQIHRPPGKWPSGFPIIRNNAFLGQTELPAQNEQISIDVTVEIRSNGFLYVARDGYWDEFVGSIGTEFMLRGVSVGNSVTIHRVASVTGNGRYLNVTPAPPVNENVTGGTIQFQRVAWTARNANGDAKVYNLTWNYIQGGGLIPPKTVSVQNVYDVPRPEQGILFFRGDASARPINAPMSGQDANKFYANGFFGGSPPPIPSGEHYFVVWGSQQGYIPNVPGTGYASGVFNIPGKSKRARFHFEFPAGLFYQEAGQAPSVRGVTIEMNIRPRAGQGYDETWYTLQAYYATKTRTPRRYTYEWDYSNWPELEWEAYCRRLTDHIPETSNVVASDAVRWIGLEGVQFATELNDDDLNCTLIELNLGTQDLNAVGTNRRLNCWAERLLPDHRNNNPGQLVEDPSVGGAIAYTMIDDAGYPSNQVDLNQLWEIQDYLDSNGLGQFNGIIDQTMTADDQVKLLCQPANIMPYRRASIMHFARLRPDLQPVALFNARNKTEPEKRTMTFAEANDSDGMVLRFLNAFDQFKEDSIQVPHDVTLTQPDDQSVLGVTNPTVAYRSALLRWNQKRLERDTVQLSVTDEGAMLLPGDIIAVTDYLTEEPPVEGEIVQVNGTQFTFDEVIPVGQWVARIRDRHGEVFASSLITISTASNVQTIAAWNGVKFPDAGSLVGLLYSFTEVQYEGQELFYVTAVNPTREGPVTIDALRYDSDVYLADSTDMPEGAAGASKTIDTLATATPTNDTGYGGALDLPPEHASELPPPDEGVA